MVTSTPFAPRELPDLSHLDLSTASEHADQDTTFQFEFDAPCSREEAAAAMVNPWVVALFVSEICFV